LIHGTRRIRRVALKSITLFQQVKLNYTGRTIIKRYFSPKEFYDVFIPMAAKKTCLIIDVASENKL